MSPQPRRRSKLVGLDEVTALSVQPVRDAAGSGAAPPPPIEGLQTLPLASIRPNPFQPRTTFDPAALQQLADTIEVSGLLQPVLVRPTGDDDEPYELVVGERRWRACALAGSDTLPAIVREDIDDQTSAELAMLENVAREDLNPIEEARGIARLRDTFGLTVAAIARRAGKDRTAISHKVRLLTLPDKAQALIEQGDLSEGHGRVLLRLDDHDARRAMAKECAAAGWSVRELERRVDAAQGGEGRAKPEPAADEVARLETLIDSIRPVTGEALVSIVRRGGGYEVRLRCADAAGLEQTVKGITGG